MSLRALSVPKMVQLSSAWLDPDKARPLIERGALTKPLIPKLREVHDALVQLRPRSDLTERLSAIIQESSSADFTHDRSFRGIYYILTGLALLNTPDDHTHSPHRELRQTLFPDGLKGTNFSYGEQAGAIEIASERLTETQRALMASTTLDDTALQTHVDAWMEAGRRLGQLEHERSALASESDTSSSQSILQARNAWIRVARLLERVVEVDDFTDEERAQLLGPMHAAER